jgi:hypothetical protein
MKLSFGPGFGGLLAVILGLLSTSAARADAIFVANSGSGTIGEYTTSGATVNAALISGLNDPAGIVVVPTTTATPEPSTLLLVPLGLLLLGVIRRASART